MACTNVEDLICEDLCKATPATDLKGTLLQNRILSTDTTIEFVALPDDQVFPCVGFILFTGCNGGNRELIYFGSQSVAVDGTVTIGDLKRGLAFTGCDLTANLAPVYDHSRTEEVLIGSTEIHYYFCKLCECLDALRAESRQVYANVGALPATGDPGERAIVWNNGKPVLYIYYDLGGGLYSWVPVYASVQVASTVGAGVVSLMCPPTNALNPLVYNQGCEVMDFIHNNGEICENVNLHFINKGIVADKGANLVINHDYAGLPPEIVPSPNDPETFYLIDNRSLIPLINNDVYVDISVVKSSIYDIPERECIEEYFFDVYNFTDAVVEYTSETIKSGYDQLLAGAGLIINYRWSQINLTGLVTGLEAGKAYQFRVYAHLKPLGPPPFIDIRYDAVIYNLVQMPRCL